MKIIVFIFAVLLAIYIIDKGSDGPGSNSHSDGRRDYEIY